MDISPTAGTPVPAWQITAGDVFMHPAGAALRIRTRDTENGLRAGMTFTGWCAGPVEAPQPWGTPALPGWSLECLASDWVDLAEDCLDSHMDEALTASGLRLVAA